MCVSSQSTRRQHLSHQHHQHIFLWCPLPLCLYACIISFVIYISACVLYRDTCIIVYTGHCLIVCVIWYVLPLVYHRYRHTSMCYLQRVFALCICNVYLHDHRPLSFPCHGVEFHNEHTTCCIKPLCVRVCFSSACFARFCSLFVTLGETRRQQQGGAAATAHWMKHTGKKTWQAWSSCLIQI